MNRVMKTALSGLALAVTALSANVQAADGAHSKGYVWVDSTASTMTATFNVRFNPMTGHEQSTVRVGASTISNNRVSFTGYDARTRRSFSCYLDSRDSTLGHNTWEQARNVHDGTFLYVVRKPNSSRCQSVTLTKSSSAQH